MPAVNAAEIWIVDFGLAAKVRPEAATSPRDTHRDGDAHGVGRIGPPFRHMKPVPTAHLRCKPQSLFFVIPRVLQATRPPFSDFSFLLSAFYFSHPYPLPLTPYRLAPSPISSARSSGSKSAFSPMARYGLALFVAPTPSSRTA